MKISLTKLNDQVISSEGNLSVKPDEISKVLTGIESFTNFSDPAPYLSKLAMMVESPAEKRDYVIDKLSSSKTFSLTLNDVQSDESLDSLGKYLNIQLDSNFFKSRLINLANLDISSTKLKIVELNNLVTINPELQSKKLESEKKVQEQKESIKSSLGDAEKTKFDRLEEIKSKITGLQGEVDFYQNEKKLKETSNNQLKDFKTKRENLNQMIDSVKLLIESKKKLASEIQKFGALTQDTTVNDKVKNLKEGRIQKQNESLFKTRKKTQEMLGSMGNAAVNTFLGKPVIALIVVELIMAILLFVLSGQVSILILGALSMIILSGLLFGINSFKEKVNAPIAKENGVLVDASNQNNFANEDNFLINAAWVNAIKTEIATVDTAMSNNLNGKDYTELEKELADIDSQEKKANEDLINLEKKSLTSEEYYKKRRELDILKIEKENLEYTFNNNASGNGIAAIEKDLEDLNARFMDAQETVNSLPFIVYGTASVPTESLLQGLDYKGQIIVLNAV